MPSTPTRHLEVERTFSPPADAELPDLTTLRSVAGAEPAGEVVLDATYLDTPDLALLRAGVTLRRRTGGADEGWHLKLPVAAGTAGTREELHLPLDAGDLGPPGELADLVDGWTRGAPLAPVAQLRTRRSITRLLDADGAELAELADDRVVGLGSHEGAQAWREWEVELVTGPPALLDKVEKLFARHGVRRSEVPRKVAHVLADPVDRPAAPRRPGRTKPAERLVHHWILEQVRAIETLDPVARRAGEGGVHGLRKASRRLRAGLATYAPLLDAERTDPVRTELRWLARALGEARDDEVVLARVEALLDAQDDEFLVGPVRERLAQRRDQRHDADRHAVAGLLGSERYHALRVALEELAADPPWTELARRRAKAVLPHLVHREWRRVRKAHSSAGDPHDLRKAAKRLRYAYESLEPIWGGDARSPRKAAQRLTRLLGDRQDGAVARALLLDLADEAAAAGESAFTYGRLHAVEERHAQVLDADVEKAWRSLAKRRW